MPHPLIACSSQPFASWLVASGVGVLILVVETAALALLARRGWPALVALAAAALAAVGLTAALSGMPPEGGAALAQQACGPNGAWQVTLGNAASVLDAYSVAPVLFGAIIALVVFGSVITFVSLVASNSASRKR